LLSRHLDIRALGDDLVLTNLFFGTRLTLTAGEFAQLPGGPRAAEAHRLHLLVEPDSVCPQWPGLAELTSRVEAYLHQELPPSRQPRGLRESLLLLQRTLTTYLELLDPEPQLAQVMFSSLWHLLEDEPGSPQGGLSKELCQRSLGRPLDARPEFEQLPCTLYTAQARAELALSLGGPTLLLGDDDLVSLSLPGCQVFELDHHLVDFLRSRQVEVRLHDLGLGLPDGHRCRYRTVVADPPYASQGFACFLDCARDALVPGGHLVLSTNLAHLEAPVDLTSWGFELLRHERAFNRYPYPADLRQSCVEKAACYDFPPELAEQIFGPPLFYADLFLLRSRR
jgi:hypothetical protein